MSVYMEFYITFLSVYLWAGFIHRHRRGPDLVHITFLSVYLWAGFIHRHRRGPDLVHITFVICVSLGRFYTQKQGPDLVHIILLSVYLWAGFIHRNKDQTSFISLCYLCISGQVLYTDTEGDQTSFSLACVPSSPCPFSIFSTGEFCQRQ